MRLLDYHYTMHIKTSSKITYNLWFTYRSNIKSKLETCSNYLYGRQQQQPNNQHVDVTFDFLATFDVQQEFSLVLLNSILVLISHPAPPGEWPINQQRQWQCMEYVWGKRVERDEYSRQPDSCVIFTEPMKCSSPLDSSNCSLVSSDKKLLRCQQRN